MNNKKYANKRNAQPMSQPDSLLPSMSLLVKLGSIAVHSQELISPNGHILDMSALRGLLEDFEVLGWLEQMDRKALLPKKR